MDSSLHMHVASLKVQDDIRRASDARLVKQAERESRAAAKATGSPSGRWVSLRRAFRPSLRHVA